MIVARPLPGWKKAGDVAEKPPAPTPKRCSTFTDPECYFSLLLCRLQDYAA